MAEVTKPIATDETLQSILAKQGQMVTALQNLSGSITRISSGTTDLVDGSSTLPTGELYLYHS